MEIKNYIEIGEKKAGKQTELAKILGISDSYIRAAKRNERGLPDAVCIELANYIEADPLEVIAASNLVTEKDERRRKVFESCFRKANSAAASMLIASIVTTVLTMAPIKPVNASYSEPVINTLYIIRNKDRRKRFRRKEDLLSAFFYRLLNFWPRSGCAG